MLVKKVNPEWQPSENPGLKVGETIEITDPKALILSGAAVGVGKQGEELSAYELYGVIIDNDLEGFEEYLKVKKANAIKAKLEQEQAALQAELDKANEVSKEAEVVVEKSTEVAESTTKKTAKK